MPLPVTFSALPEGDNPASLIDDQFQALSGFAVIPCQAVGQNDIQLFPFADAPVIYSYTDLSPVFAFAATQTCSGTVTLNVMNAEGAGLGARPAYKNNGAALVEDGDMVAGLVYQAAWLTALGGGGGGFVVNIFGAASPPPAPWSPPPPIPGGNSMPINMIFFTSNQIYTPSSGMVSCIVECAGGGGGGGGAFGNGFHAGGGGGSGGYSRALLSAAEVGASQSIIIGPGGAAGATGSGGDGGATSFGNLVIANGGRGGQGYDATSIWGFPGAGAAAGTVQAGRGIALPGNGGRGGFSTASPGNLLDYGGGAGSMWGGAAQEPIIGNAQGANANGNAGQYGAGGTGAVSNSDSSAVWIPGGAGGAGWCCVTEFS